MYNMHGMFVMHAMSTMLATATKNTMLVEDPVIKLVHVTHTLDTASYA